MATLTMRNVKYVAERHGGSVEMVGGREGVTVEYVVDSAPGTYWTAEPHIHGLVMIFDATEPRAQQQDVYADALARMSDGVTPCEDDEDTPDCDFWD